MRSTLLINRRLGMLNVGAAAQETPPTAEVRRALAPTGTLRVGLYVGNPSSLVKEPVAGQATGDRVRAGPGARSMAGRSIRAGDLPEQRRGPRGLPIGQRGCRVHECDSGAIERDRLHATVSGSRSRLSSSGPRSPIAAMAEVDRPGCASASWRAALRQRHCLSC